MGTSYDNSRFQEYMQMNLNGETNETEQFLYHLAEKLSYTYIEYHTYMRRLKPEYPEMSTERVQMLGAIRVQGKCSLKKLCKILYISHSNGSIMVNKLVQLGLVLRIQNSVDRRKVLLSLTQKGQELADKFLREEIFAYCEKLRGLDESEMARLSEALDVMLDLFDRTHFESED